MDSVRRVIAGRYELVRHIAQGGMGTVYEGRHLTTGKRCAVKILSAPGLERDVELVRRFSREARACSVIESDHVVEVFDSGFDDEVGQAYLVMELLRGDDLEQVLKQNAPLDPSVAVRLMLQATTGMAKAHRLGILHRDLKPANLFLTTNEDDEVVVKILDFGVAKVRVESSLDISSGTLTRTGRLLGTPLYMSPEQVRNDPSLDGRSDVWSLGVVLFEMLSGALPYSRRSSFGELMVSILTSDLPLLQDVAPWVEPELAAVAHRALARSIEDRYQDAEALRQALLPLAPNGDRVERREVQVVSQGQRSRVADRLNLPGPELLRLTGSAPPVERPSRPVRRDLGVLAAAGALGAVVAFATAGAMSRHDSQPDPHRVPDGPSPSAAALASSATRASSAAVKIAAVPLSEPVREQKTQWARVAPGVSVQVRGAPVASTDGRIPFTGAIGEAFAVQLRRGSAVHDVEVVLSERGPVPELLDVPARRPTAAMTQPTVHHQTSSAKSSAPVTPTAPTAPDIALTENTDEFTLPRPAE